MVWTPDSGKEKRAEHIEGETVFKTRTDKNVRAQIESFVQKIMKKNKAKGQDPKDAIKSFDEAEILFSTKNKLTRDWFRE